jgi:acyl-coenzyme A synthetase/AMP-(fatty) acid ligase
VVPRAGAALDAPALLAWSNARLGKVQRIYAVEVVAALPRSPIGKVLKRELRAAFVARHPETARSDSPDALQ